MKNYASPKSKVFTCLTLLLFVCFSCTKTDPSEEMSADPIVGQWFLVSVNDTDVPDVECYQESYIESDAEIITFFIQDRLENGDCETVLSGTEQLTIEEDFYYLGNEALEIYIEGRTLSWRVDLDTNLEFRK